jgi:hypothetical protein
MSTPTASIPYPYYGPAPALDPVLHPGGSTHALKEGEIPPHGSNLRFRQAILSDGSVRVYWRYYVPVTAWRPRKTRCDKGRARGKLVKVPTLDWIDEQIKRVIERGSRGRENGWRQRRVDRDVKRAVDGYRSRPAPTGCDSLEDLIDRLAMH